jgi:hypothetical protein
MSVHVAQSKAALRFDTKISFYSLIVPETYVIILLETFKRSFASELVETSRKIVVKK